MDLKIVGSFSNCKQYEMEHDLDNVLGFLIDG